MQIVNSNNLSRDEEGYLYFQDKPFIGMMEWYYESGEIGEQFEYFNGYQHGSSKAYFKSGKLMFEKFYNEGCISGQVKKWFDNGQLKYDGEIFDGKEKWCKEWNEDGVLIREYYN